MHWQQIPIPRQLRDLLRRYQQAQRFRRSVQQSLTWHHAERDPREAHSSTPPADERIELQCVWVTEAYTPSRIDGLITSLKKRGWDKAAFSLGMDTSLVEQIQQSRRAGNLTSWMNAGVILAPGDDSFPGAERRYAELPAGVAYGRLVVRAVTGTFP